MADPGISEAKEGEWMRWVKCWEGVCCQGQGFGVYLVVVGFPLLWPRRFGLPIFLRFASLVFHNLWRMPIGLSWTRHRVGRGGILD